MATGVVIASAGIVSPIGVSLAEAAAAARARVARLREIDWYDRRSEPFIVGTVPDDVLPPLDGALAREALPAREARMLRLAHAALEQVVAALPAQAGAPALLLGLPEHHTTQSIDAKRFLARLAQQSQYAIDLQRSVAAARGRAAGVMALKQAVARLERGECEFAIVGGVDCLVDPYVLGTLDLQQRVRGETVSDGLSPSEGAAFLLLTTAALARSASLAVLARVSGAALGKEAGHVYADTPYLGEGLAGVFTELLAGAAPTQPIGCVYATFNGERYWAREFSTARVRNARHFAEEVQMEHPAECFGDLGAAFGPALVALAAHGVHAGYRAAPCLTYASSDFGDRAAILLERAV
jgi:3-oxoacyl-[acyl-carrier-protein] synthase I